MNQMFIQIIHGNVFSEFEIKPFYSNSKNEI